MAPEAPTASMPEAPPAPVAAVSTSGRRTSTAMMLVVILLLVGEGVAIYLVTSYVKAPQQESVLGIQGMEFVDFGEMTTTVRMEGAPTVRYFRLGVAVYLGANDRDMTKQMIEKLKPKIKDEIQTIIMQETYSTLRQVESKRRIKDKIKDLLVQMIGPDRIDEVSLPLYEPQ